MQKSRSTTSLNQKKCGIERARGDVLLLIDNFDSFTYNLVQCFRTLGTEVVVVRGKMTNAEECLAFRPSHIVIGPGPGSPNDAPLSLQLIRETAEKIPLLGVCLGHQALAEVWGGKVVRAKVPMHGKTSAIAHNQKGIFEALPQYFTATRYHSLVVEEVSLPSVLEITARSEQGEIMALQHRYFPHFGVQFHPESILTTHGVALLKNFLTS